LKKAILLISIFLFSQIILSENKDYFFYKDGAILLSPLENPNKNLLKILDLLSSKKYKKAKSKLYNLKLEFKDEKNFPLLEKFIDFLEKKENNGSDLIPFLDENIISHKQIKAEILWLLCKEIDSFKIYGTLPEEILNKKDIKKTIDKRVKDYSSKLENEIEEGISKGNFDGLCLKIKELPEKIFKENAYFKGKTICAIIKRDIEEASLYFEKLEEKDKKEYQPFIKILNLELAEQLRELKNGKFDERFKKFSKYLYNKIEDEWLLQNMPPCYLKAYNSENINLKEMALLFCLYFPQIKTELSDDFKILKENSDIFENECLYSLILGKIIDKEILEEKINSENFIFYLKKFIVFLNLIVPCEESWDSFVKCGIISEEKEKDKISGEFVSSIIRKLKGDL